MRSVNPNLEPRNFLAQFFLAEILAKKLKNPHKVTGNNATLNIFWCITRRAKLSHVCHAEPLSPAENGSNVDHEVFVAK